MKKRLLTLSILLFGGLGTVLAQDCNIDVAALNNYLSNKGLSWGSRPDTTDNLPAAAINMVYDQTIEIKWPQDVKGFDSTQGAIPYNTVEITDVIGLPTGMTFTSPSSTTDDIYCAGTGGGPVSSCKWNDAQYGCIRINGTPTALGTYPIRVVLNVNIPLVGDRGGNFDGFTIIVTPVGVDIIQDGDQVELKQNVPNPFDHVTNIKFNTETSVDAEFYVMNLLGEMVHTQKLKSNVGENNIKFDGSDLNEGIYMYTLQVGEKKITKRMVISK